MLQQIFSLSFMTAFLAAAVRLAVPLMYGGIGETIAAHNITPYNYGDFLLRYCGCCHNGRADKYFFHVYDIIITV